MNAPRLADLDDVLTPEEVASFLKCSRDHVYTMVRERRLPGFKVGQLVRIRKAALIEWMEGGTRVKAS